MNTVIDGEEKAARLSELESEIDSLKKKYEEDEEEQEEPKNNVLEKYMNKQFEMIYGTHKN